MLKTYNSKSNIVRNCLGKLKFNHLNDSILVILAPNASQFKFIFKFIYNEWTILASVLNQIGLTYCRRSQL